MKKKGIWLVSTETVRMILIAVVLIVIIAAIVKISNKSQGYNAEICKVSVIANSKIRDPFTNTEVWDLKCPTRYVHFEKDGYTEESGIPEEGGYSGKTSFKTNMRQCKIGADGTYEECKYLEMVNEAIAEHIYDCWSQFGAGELSVFSNYETSRQCVICTVIDFSSDVRERFGDVYASEILDEEDTLDNLMRTTGPNLDREITYYEYLEDPLDHFEKEYYDYNFEESYAIVFTALNEDCLQNVKQKAWSFVKEKLLHKETDDVEYGFINSISMMQQDEVAMECDILADQ